MSKNLNDKSNINKQSGRPSTGRENERFAKPQPSKNPLPGKSGIKENPLQGGKREHGDKSW